jgi:hypothetical protein
MFASLRSSMRRGPLHLASGSFLVVGLAAWSGSASAYRPFDGTDAAVACLQVSGAGAIRADYPDSWNYRMRRAAVVMHAHHATVAASLTSPRARQGNRI